MDKPQANVPNEDLTIPMDYTNIFENRLTVITGVARSGTTIMGKLVGSFESCFYVFEPIFPRYLSLLYKIDDENARYIKQIFRAILFEDLYENIIQGRYLNFNPDDLSYIGHYTSEEEAKERWNRFSGKADVMKFLDDNTVELVFKLPGMQPYFDTLADIFSGIKIIDITRNGSDVVSSSVKKNWYTKEHDQRQSRPCKYQKDQDTQIGAPWYLDPESREYFSSWNQYTRAASIWRSLVSFKKEQYHENNEDFNYFSLKYENLIEAPEEICDDLLTFTNRKKTTETEKNLEDIKNHKPSQYDSVLDKILEPECSKFVREMKKNGYKIER